MGLTFNLGRISPSVFTDSSLNVGIGAAPSGSYKLEVTGTGYFSGILTTGSNVGIGVTPSAWYNLAAYVALQVGNASLFGRNSANSELYLSSNVYDNSSGAATYITTDFASRYIQNDGTHTWLTAPSGTAGTAVTFTPRMTILQGGNVGIGTSSPSYLLDINGMARILRNGGDEALRISNDNGYIGFFNTANSTRSAYIQGNTTSLQISSSLAIPIQFLTSDAEKMRIRADGIISLGAGYAAANSFNYFPIYSAGQPGFNLLSSTSTDLLAFNGNTKALFLGNLTGGATTLSVDASGNIIRTGSDVNLKTNVENLQYGLETIMQLRPIIHNWVESANMGEGKSIGFIAQEVELLVPEIVCGDEYKSIDYPKMVAILTKAIQELSNRLIKLENK
jgi:hypothetical protein